MSLFDDLKVFKDYKYYPQTPNIDFDNLDKESSYKFIRGTYRVGCKEKIFNVGFLDLFEQNGKHIHTVILYFLGYIVFSNKE